MSYGDTYLSEKSDAKWLPSRGNGQINVSHPINRMKTDGQSDVIRACLSDGNG